MLPAERFNPVVLHLAQPKPELGVARSPRPSSAGRGHSITTIDNPTPKQDHPTRLRPKPSIRYSRPCRRPDETEGARIGSYERLHRRWGRVSYAPTPVGRERTHVGAGGAGRGSLSGAVPDDRNAIQDSRLAGRSVGGASDSVRARRPV
jgi:hypothetical protein